MRNIVILNSLHFSYPLPILMRVSYNTLIVKQNTSDYYKYRDKAVVFAFDIHPRYAEKTLPVRLQGLDADKMYRVKEINLMPGANSSLSGNGEVFSGEFLMNVGLNLFTTQQLNSRVIEVVAE